MTQDHNKKSQRQFQCRDYLWEIFEQMGAELECSTDYLINEAMRQYARSRNWGSRAAGRGSVPSIAPVAVTAPPPAASAGSTSARAPTAPTMPTVPAPARSPAGGSQFGVTLPAPIPSPVAAPAAPPPPLRAAQPSMAPGPRPPLPAPPGSQRASSPSIPQPLPSGGNSQPLPTRGAMPSLFVIFNGQKVPVNKEEFVIGRGSKTADLAIKDGNISRRHAAIVLQNGAFYMKDLGSTNGVEFEGQRVDSRRIEEGDVYQMCDYELRFTYQP
jgi:pSer/pThr/pTyr-binding forkhead associated (FHA) protein